MPRRNADRSVSTANGENFLEEPTPGQPGVAPTREAEHANGHQAAVVMLGVRYPEGKPDASPSSLGAKDAPSVRNAT